MVTLLLGGSVAAWSDKLDWAKKLYERGVMINGKQKSS